MSADRNLLFGILALQNDFVTRDQLIAAMNDWVLEKQSPLGVVLRRRGFLAEDEHVLLDALVNKQIAKHGGDVDKSIRTLELATSVRESLTFVHDPDLQATLSSVGRSADRLAETVDPISDATAKAGRYQIVRPHAAGGLGEVFVAVDTELHREIALKLIKDQHADRADARARFVVEAEVTGGLEHPGIVPVYGLGQYADGRPFYAMRFIRGDSLKEAIERFYRPTSNPRKNPTRQSPDFNSLDFRSLLRRFIDVCNAIAYAHSRGILHRDLKPGNIMLGKYGETLVVDWGLAKALGTTVDGVEASIGPLVPASGSGSGSVETVQGATLGTPAYMSPEQAAGKINELGPATDVYSLGATLYSLLTGGNPFHGRTFPDILEAVASGDLALPHTVQSGVPSRLEAVCQKAMSVRPLDRYRSPLDLAQDLERWLADEPVSVYREPIVDRIRRQFRKRAAMATGIAATLIVGLVGLGIGMTVVGIKNRALDAALVRETEQREKAVANEALAVRNQQSAEANEALARENQRKADIEFRRAKKAIDDYFTAVSESKELKEKYPGMHEFRLKLLEKAQKYYEEFLKERGDDPALKTDAATAFFNRAIVAEATGKAVDAIASYKLALPIWESLALANPSMTEHVSAVAGTCNNLGLLYTATGNVKAALASYSKALAVRTQLVRDHPTRPAFNGALADTYNDLGNLQTATGDIKAALASHSKALAIREKLVRENPTAIQYAGELAKLRITLAHLQSQIGETKAALTNYSTALAVFEKLARDNPSVTEYVNTLAHTQNDMGVLLRATGDTKAAQASYSKALAIREKLAHDNPAVTEYASDWAASHHNLGNLQNDTGNAKAAIENYFKAVAILEKLNRENPTVISYASELARSYNALANVHGDVGDVKTARDNYAKALVIQERLTRENPAVIEFACELAYSLNNLGELQKDTGDRLAALANYAKALAIFEKLARDNPSVTEFAAGLGGSYCNLGDGIRSAQPMESLEYFGKAINALQSLAKGDSKAKQYLRNSYGGRAQTFVQLERFDEAVADFEVALKLDDGSMSGPIRKERADALAKKAAKAKSIGNPQNLLRLGINPNDTAKPAERKTAAKKNEK